MRIVIDLDGTICELKREGQSYADVSPVAGAAEALKTLKQAGHTLIIHTARNMKTCEGNVGKVVANVGKLTLDWLEYHGIVYDELVFGKPYGHLYIDDLACTFRSWEEAAQRVSALQEGTRT
ncbi:HAD hydrolase family protein [Paenibacillus chitinolyticus]|uniref:HAD hydrolase family protein n=1 Tax=Paenibacillus chitinolyticus TaxID=79263 RepID=UPI003864B3C4